jgi:hypothetical protein
MKPYVLGEPVKIFNKSVEANPLQDAIVTLYSKLEAFQPDSEEYDAITDQIVKLKKLQHETTHSWRPSPDAVIGAAGSVLGILLILKYEQIHIVTSKALGFVGKLK